MIYFEQSMASKDPNAAFQLMEQAKANFETAIKYDPSYVDALRNLGVIHAIRKEFPQAIQYFERGLRYARTDDQRNTLTKYLSDARQGK